MQRIGNKLISFIVGIFAFTIIKVIFSLCLMLLVNQNVISVDTYEAISFLFILISIYLAVKVVEAVNGMERLKVRIIFRIAIIIIGFISGVLLGINNSLVKSSSEDISRSTDVIL